MDYIIKAAKEEYGEVIQKNKCINKSIEDKGTVSNRITAPLTSGHRTIQLRTIL
jgi:hypothetical protein